MAGTLFDEALTLHQSGRIAEAEKIYRSILQQQPDHPGASHLLGVIRQQQGDYQAALDLIGRAIAINPNKAVYRNNYGAVLLSLERFAEAEESFRRALTICPRYPDALANLGMAQAARGEETAAETSLRQAIQIQPWHRDATVRLATLLGNCGRDAEARQLLEAALAVTPCAEYHAALGNLFLSAGLLQPAVDEYRAAIELTPGDPIAHFNLGNACEELHDRASARQLFARAAELRPGNRLWRLRAELCGPVVFENGQEIARYCESVSKALERRKAEDYGMSSVPRSEETRADGSLKDLLEAGVFPGLAFSYHGRDQRRAERTIRCDLRAVLPRPTAANRKRPARPQTDRHPGYPAA